MSDETLFVPKVPKPPKPALINPEPVPDIQVTETGPCLPADEEEKIDDVETKEGPKTKPYPTGRRKLQEAVGLISYKDWLGWVQSDLVRGPWIELWNNYLRDLPDLRTGVRMNTVLRRLQDGEVDDQCRYSIDAVDKSGWDKIDHHARFVWKIKDNNLRSCRGAFYNKGMCNEEMELIIWALKEWLLFVHSPANIDRPYAGVAALFGTGRERPGNEEEMQVA
ncbi:hypothetical protein BJX64DRAFT_289583 [Aspergillus heterothallicus]